MAIMHVSSGSSWEWHIYMCHAVYGAYFFAFSLISFSFLCLSEAFSNDISYIDLNCKTCYSQKKKNIADKNRHLVCIKYPVVSVWWTLKLPLQTYHFIYRQWIVNKAIVLSVLNAFENGSESNLHLECSHIRSRSFWIEPIEGIINFDLFVFVEFE